MHRLTEFVNQFVETYNEEQKDKALWDIWLHRVFDKSYNEFVEGMESKNKAAPTQEEKASIVAESLNMLNGFSPARE